VAKRITQSARRHTLQYIYPIHPPPGPLCLRGLEDFFLVDAAFFGFFDEAGLAGKRIALGPVHEGAVGGGGGGVDQTVFTMSRLSLFIIPVFITAPNSPASTHPSGRMLPYR